MSASRKIPLPVRYISKFNRAKVKVIRTLETIAENMGSKDSGILGAYNTSNVGDYSFKLVLREVLSQNSKKASFLNFSDLNQVSLPHKIIFGGGGVVTARSDSPLTKALRYLKNFDPKNLALVGVSGELTKDEISNETYKLFSNCRFFSVRSKLEYENFKSIFGNIVSYQPDIVFGMQSMLRRLNTASSSEKCVGINVCPGLFNISGDTMVAIAKPSSWYIKHLPHLAKVFSEISPRYIELVTQFIHVYQKRGYKIKIVPFADEDYVLSKTFFSLPGVNIIPYTLDPYAVYREVASCSLFFASRFHSHIFSLIAEVPTLSFAYSEKCKYLWSDLNLPVESQVDLPEMVNSFPSVLERITSHEGVALPAATLNDLSDKALEGCKQAIQSVF